MVETLGSSMLWAENAKPHHTWDTCSYWDLRWDIPQGWVGYLTALGEGGPLSLPWDPIVLLPAGTVETHHTWDGRCTPE